MSGRNISSRDGGRDRDDQDRRDRYRRKRSRSRSRSRSRDRRRRSRSRSRSRSRDRNRDRRRNRSRSRSRSRDRHRRGSPADNKRPRSDTATDHDADYKNKAADGTASAVNGDSTQPSAAAGVPAAPTDNVNVSLDAEISPEEIQIMIAMGIPFSFDTTQGKHIDDESVNVGAVKVGTKRKARQYMNRRGGFNRPLPAERTNEKVRRD